jgi:hypothetical protein
MRLRDLGPWHYHLACAMAVGGVLIFTYLAWPDQVGWGIVSVLMLVASYLIVRW